jgi:hypothetical protein
MNVITAFERSSAWVKPCGEVMAKKGVYAHHALIEGGGYHGGAFRRGHARVCMDTQGVLSVQWRDKLTSAQRRVLEDVMQTATVLLVSSVVDGYDPELMAMDNSKSRAGDLDSKRRIPASFVRKIRQALRIDMKSHKRLGMECHPE